MEDKNLYKKPQKQSNFSRSDNSKYCRFHRENGHETSKCYQLRGYIEKLIMEGYLKDVDFEGIDD
ncbi:hypothetical protein Dsin_001130 [Dipteronia sinensis]|uniref:Uncharacterized protein n=1 Tax=Dipteronia sinensis TaxID=43782 RepID=A0AAE0B504_9ROSI|nr:hypothetical protein Dsin_001130 [Dipteronia sinensis]